MKLGSPSPLTPKMASRVMAFATMMMATMTSMVTQLSLDGAMDFGRLPVLLTPG